jgi:hypothetical protein
MAKMQINLNKLYKFTVKGAASKTFFLLVLAVSVLQNLWYVFSMQPNVFDEGSHLGLTAVYAHRLNPFMATQPTSLDYLGEVTRNSSYLYYYLMSWPARFIDAIIHSPTLRIILLRLISVILFTAGLIVYRKVLLRLCSSKAVVHAVLLFFILIPSVAPLGGAVSGLLLLVGINIIGSRQLNFLDVFWLLLLGMFGTLIKFESSALFAPVFLYVIWDIWSKHKTKTVKLLMESYQRLASLSKIGTVVLFVIIAGLFIERPVYNLVKYHAISPACQSIISEQRCMQNYTDKRSIVFAQEKPASFNADSPYEYMLTLWIPGMITSNPRLLPWQALHIMSTLNFVFALGGACLVLVFLRDFLERKAYRFAVVVLAGYVFVLVAYNYSAYVAEGQPVSITSRYLVPILPIFMVMVVQALIWLFGEHRKLLLTFGIVTLLCFTQGGGIMTSILTVPTGVLWQKHSVVRVNQSLGNGIRRYLLL